MRIRHSAYLFLLIATVMWGAAGPVIKFTLGGIEPFSFLSYRLFISAVIATVLLIIIKPKIPRLRDLGALVVYGLLATTFALGFLFMGLARSSVLEAGLIGAVGPLAVAAGGAIFLKERITKREKTGILIAFVGTMFTIVSPAILGQDGFKIGGNFLLFMFLISDASSILIAKSMLKKKFDPFVMTSVAFIVGALTIIPFTILSTGFSGLIQVVVSLPLKYHLGVWYMAVISGTIAYFLFMKGVRLIEASEAVLFVYLQPIFSAPLAVFWLGETFTIPYIMGLALVAAGVYIAERRKY